MKKSMLILIIPVLLGGMITMNSCKDDEETPAEVCDNAMDDDGDGLTDCDDPDCLGSGPCGFPSDLRLKEGVRPLVYGLEEVMALDPVRFRYKTSEGEHIGLIAQDVLKVIPEAVFDDPATKTDLLSIRYEELVPVLIRAIQEQQAMIEELRRQNSVWAESESH